MALNERLRQSLAQEGIEYETRPHREVFTAQEVAATSHISGKQLAKVVLVRAEGGHIMAVLPAACRVDLAALSEVSGRRGLSLATEEEMGRVFPDCEIGAMPPFGNLYGIPVYIDRCFPQERDFFFQAGNHHEVVRMRYADYERLVKPVLGDFRLEQR